MQGKQYVVRMRGCDGDTVQVVYVPQVSNADLPKLFASADAFVLPTHGEVSFTTAAHWLTLTLWFRGGAGLSCRPWLWGCPQSPPTGACCAFSGDVCD